MPADFIGALGRISVCGAGSPVACRPARVEDQCLYVVAAAAFPLATVVKVEIGNHLWMGPVSSCEPAPEGFALEVQIEAALNDVANVADLAARFRHERLKPATTPLPLSSTRRDL